MIARLAEWLGLPAETVSALPGEAQQAIWARMEAQMTAELHDELVGHLVGVLASYKDAARTDQLTGLLNRRGLAEQLRAMGHPRTLGVIVIDVDAFKAINDRYGHSAGDATLQCVAARLRGAVRQRDLVARWGGDEFLLVCLDVTEEAVDPVAQKVLTAVCSDPVVVDGTPVPVSISVGWSLAVDGRSAQHVVEIADEAMYRAKAAGGGRVEGDQQAARSQ